MEIVKILDKNIQVIEYKSQRVVTFKQIDELHQRPEGTADRNFRENKDKFEEDKHFFKISIDEIRGLGIPSLPAVPKGIILLTEKG